MSGTRTGLLSRVRPDWYLVLIIAMAAVASVLPARGEAAVWLGWISKVSIGAVFFLHGARLSREAVLKGANIGKDEFAQRQRELLAPGPPA